VAVSDMATTVTRFTKASGIKTNFTESVNIPRRTLSIRGTFDVDRVTNVCLGDGHSACSAVFDQPPCVCFLQAV